MAMLNPMTPRVVNRIAYQSHYLTTAQSVSRFDLPLLNLPLLRDVIDPSGLFETKAQFCALVFWSSCLYGDHCFHVEA